MSTYKSNEPQSQPKMIKFNGNTYLLYSKFLWVDKDAGICSGPFYLRGGGSTNELYMPDAAYLYAGQPLSFMHRIKFG